MSDVKGPCLVIVKGPVYDKGQTAVTESQVTTQVIVVCREDGVRHSAVKVRT